MPQSNEDKKKIREERRKAGLCTMCGNRPPKDDGSTCEHCRRYYKSYHERKGANDHCRRCGEPCGAGRKNCESCLQKQRVYSQSIKDAAFEAYDGYRCKCCGEKHREFLQLDHINNDGNTHRKLVGATGGSKLYLWLRNHGYPPIMQVLCANCNYAKAHYGFCPHQPDREVNDAPLRRDTTQCRTLAAAVP